MPRHSTYRTTWSIDRPAAVVDVGGVCTRAGFTAERRGPRSVTDTRVADDAANGACTQGSDSLDVDSTRAGAGGMAGAGAGAGTRSPVLHQRMVQDWDRYESALGVC